MTGLGFRPSYHGLCRIVGRGCQESSHEGLRSLGARLGVLLGRAVSHVIGGEALAQPPGARVLRVDLWVRDDGQTRSLRWGAGENGGAVNSALWEESGRVREEEAYASSCSINSVCSSRRPAMRKSACS